jgi:hypothetical protein
VRIGLAWFKVGTWKMRIINDEVAYKIMIDCAKAVELGDMRE